MTKQALSALLLALSLLLSSQVVLAQTVPGYLPVQGTLSDDDGTPRDGTFTLHFRLYSEAEAGPAFYADTQEVTVEEGLFTAYVGDGEPADLGDGTTSGPLDLSAFQHQRGGIIFLGVSVAENDEMTPRLQLGTVPYAAHALSCGDAQKLGGVAVDALHPRLSGSCQAGQAVVGYGVDGSFLCAAHAGPQGDAGPRGEPGTTAWDGLTGVPAGFSDGVDNQVELAGSGGAATAARSDHTHEFNMSWYTVDTEGEAATTTGAHSFCALSRVRFNGNANAANDHWCQLSPNAGGTWALQASAASGERTRCNIYCF